MSCVWPKCPKEKVSRGMCRAHYEKAKRSGAWPTFSAPPRFGEKHKAPPCKVCRAVSYAGGLCYLHWERKKAGRKMRAPKRGTTGPITTSQGYRAVHLGDSRYKMEHREIMERKLGRPLLPEETVHHKNGVRDDNRETNLELWSSSQPPGQRVEDKLAWAYEMIALYGR